MQISFHSYFYQFFFLSSSYGLQKRVADTFLCRYVFIISYCLDSERSRAISFGPLAAYRHTSKNVRKAEEALIY